MRSVLLHFVPAAKKHTKIYTGFEPAATEAGISGLYGGIHYRPSIDAGKVQSIKVGENVQHILHTDK